MRQIPERDWKAWRRLSADALERFCERVLDEIGAFRKPSGSAHSRYLELFRYLHDRDDEMAEVFNDQRRSNAYLQIATAVRMRIVSPEELTVFSTETKELVEALSAIS